MGVSYSKDGQSGRVFRWNLLAAGVLSHHASSLTGLFASPQCTKFRLNLPSRNNSSTLQLEVAQFLNLGAKPHAAA
jgi:hypothetical protein